MSRDRDYLKHLLELEYEHSRLAIDKFDDYRARLKGWMITASAGIAAVAYSAHTTSIFWAGGVMVVLFELSELLYIDIQEEAIARNRELVALLDSLSRDLIGPEHEAYRFGLGKVFGGGRLLRLASIRSWIGYRAFNPLLYGSLIFLMLAAALVAPV
jgi:hypothetical protein